ncbi:hypothetical protein GE21DRAFT_1119359 [Neurospora crassa]|nr:hypothetical protein GE21DRAFT_1119359 [Neurospora crassa]
MQDINDLIKTNYDDIYVYKSTSKKIKMKNTMCQARKQPISKTLRLLSTNQPTNQSYSNQPIHAHSPILVLPFLFPTLVENTPSLLARATLM